jgi:hypothetical protein
MLILPLTTPQVCYEPLAPPTHIFQCGKGHLVCGVCRPTVVFRCLEEMEKAGTIRLPSLS